MPRGARLFGLVMSCASLWPATASARPSGCVVRRYTTADGLSQSTVYALAQDSDGYLWVGTENGLNRFDGVRFQHFDTDDGLVENSVAYLFADREGRVWISQEGALVRRGADGSLRVFHYPDALGSVSTQSAVEDDDGVHFGAADSIIESAATRSR